MLQTLTVKNLALLEGLETDLSAGFSALTGETGAGKSLLLDALGLLLGERADGSLIRHGEQVAEVVGHFKPATTPSLLALLEDHGLGVEEGALTLRRQLKKEDAGKATSRAWVNGVPVPQAVLGSLAPHLAEIQGQHSAPDLLQPTRQREVLDATGQLAPQLEKTAVTYAAWQVANREAKAAQQRLSDAETHQQTHAIQLKMLSELAYQSGEETTLQVQRNRLQNGAQIAQSLTAADDALNAEKGALTSLRLASRALHQAAKLDDTLTPTAQTLAESLLTLEDTAHTIARAANAEAEGSLEAIDDRLHALKNAARSLQCTPDELPAKLEELQSLSLGTGPLQEAATQAAAAATAAYNTFRAACKSLTEARQQAAKKLVPDLQKTLRALLLPHALIEVSFTPLPEDNWGPQGAETLQLLMAANPGSPLQPVSKVASGGELARLLLALKQVLYAALPPQLLVLDEVDTGLSGAAASAVGAAMAALGQRHQVLAVTHHAQVAAQANHHAKLAKQVEGGTTRTSLTWLTPTAREDELARLLAGAKVTDEARAAAQSLLKEAKAA